MGRKTPKGSPQKQSTPSKAETDGQSTKSPPQAPKKSHPDPPKSETPTPVKVPATCAAVKKQMQKQTPPTKDITQQLSNKLNACRLETNSTTEVEQKLSTAKSVTNATNTEDNQHKKIISNESQVSNEDEVEEETKEKWNYDEEVKKLMNVLQSQYYVSEQDKATVTLRLLEAIITEDTRWKTTRELLDILMTIGREISSKVPHETTSRNIIYKVRKIIVDEFHSVVREFTQTPDIGSAKNYFRCIAMQHDVTMDLPAVPEGVDAVVVGGKVKEGTIAALEEYNMELDNIPTCIGKQGCKIISEGDRIMTYAFCPNLVRLFLDAAEHCNFTLYVVESQPLCYGHFMVDKLQNSNIEIILVPDCNIAALMPMVDKVIMPCIAVLFNGDLKTIAYGGVIAAVAESFKKEVYAVAATYQFTLSVIANKNLSLSPFCIDEDPMEGVAYCTKKFDLTDSADVVKIITNTVQLTPLQASKHLADLYSPRFEKEEY